MNDLVKINKCEVAGVSLLFMRHAFLVVTVQMLKIGVHLKTLSQN